MPIRPLLTGDSPSKSSLGDAVLAAQQGYAETGAFPERLAIYHPFGDPALLMG
jgi:hypothetical protein